MRVALLLLCLSLLVACGDESGDLSVNDSPPQIELASNLTLNGTAFASDSLGRTIECSLDLEIALNPEANRTSERVEYTGTHTGEVGRRVLVRDSSDVTFSAIVFGDVRLHLIAPDSVVLQIPANEDAGSRFWREIAQFAGTVDSEGSGTGRWRCAPLDVVQNAFVDTSLVAKGQWHLQPQNR